jgi:hypothetical protein
LQQRGQRAAIYASHKSRLMNRIEVQVSERNNVYLPTLKVSGSNPHGDRNKKKRLMLEYQI